MATILELGWNLNAPPGECTFLVTRQGIHLHLHHHHRQLCCTCDHYESTQVQEYLYANPHYTLDLQSRKIQGLDLSVTAEHIDNVMSE